MTIVVCPLSRVEEVMRARRASRIITLLDPAHPELETDWPQVDAYDAALREAGIAPSEHLRLGVHDISDAVDGLLRADEALVRQIFAFGQNWDPRETLLVHCWAGISRSTATAYALACEKNPAVDPHEIALQIRARSPTAKPNRRIVELADAILQRGGGMLEGLEAMGPAPPAMEAEPFAIESRW